MSSHSYSEVCPNCGKEMDVWQDTRPFNMTYGECKYCGFGFTTKAYQMSLKELNEVRKDHKENFDEDLKPLKKRPKLIPFLKDYIR